MKTALQLAVYCALSGVGFLGARGDDAVSKSPTTPVKVVPGAAIAEQAASAPHASSWIQPSVLNNLEFSTTDPEQIAEQTLQLSQQRRSAPNDLYREAEEQKAIEQHDWILKNYQNQLVKNGLEKAPAPDIYAAANRKLQADPMDSLLPPTQTPEGRKTGLGGTSGDTPKDTIQSGLDSPLLLPQLLPPLIGSDKTPPTQDYFGGSSTKTEDMSSVIDTSPAIPTDISSSSILDIPGMTAAQDGLPHDALTLDDRLPDEPIDASAPRISQNTFALPEAPMNDSDAFFKKQSESMHAPNAPTFQALVAPPTVPGSVYVQPVRPPPKPVMDGLRVHVADPFDYLNR